MGRWQYEEVAGDRYIYDLSETPYVLGIPNGACKWVIQGEQDAAAMMACSAHNADCAAYEKRIADLERRLAEYEHASGAGHPQPCTLGPLCPYCRIAALEAELVEVVKRVRRLARGWVAEGRDNG